ncbi:DnaJ domain-containing protein [Mucilaginibacter sp.]
MKDFYYILGTDVNCSSIEIKEAYRKLSKKFHPDLNQNDKYFEDRFKEIQLAYEVLNDPVRRKQYDDTLSKFKSSQNIKATTNGSFKTRPSAIAKTRRAIDILFTLVLISITCIFGDYVIKAMNTPEKINSQPALTALPVVTITKTRHHKKKHFIKPEIVAASSPKIIKAITPVKTDTIKPKPHPVKIALVAPKPVKIIAVNNNFLYSTMVKANVTGIINMREQDNLSSEVVQQIPNYSQVDVLERGERYYKVRYNNNTGYIPKWVVQTK